jgi:predicted regulator of Ras-like GTPase activity (Roadblock/LC7/MglB family)
MKEGLAEINEIVGVWGSLVCGNQGELIEVSTPPALNKSTLENTTRHLNELLATTGSSIEGLSEVILHYQDRKIFMQDLEKALLVVICTPSVDVSLLRLSVSVVLTRWAGDPKVQKTLQRYIVDRV